MSLRFAKPDEIANWNQLLTTNPDGGNIFACREIADTKRLTGWRAKYLAGKGYMTVLEKSVPGLGKLWYLPKGPGVTDVDTLQELLPLLKAKARKQGVFAVKIEPELVQTTDTQKALESISLIKSQPIQPNHSTIVLDLSGSLDDIMARLGQKSRHAIRRAERDGVTARAVEYTPANARQMYNLLIETAAGKFRLRRFDYYDTFWRNLIDQGRGQLFFARRDDTVVAGAFVMFLGQKGTYKDGASVRQRSAYGASHLLQWESIKWMKKHKVQTYDMCGTPPSHQINDTSHPYYGIGRFKASFSKHVTDYVGAYDLVVSPTRYKLWSKIGERAVLRIHSAVRGENWY